MRAPRGISAVEMPAILPMGDTGALLSFGEEVDSQIMAQTHSLAAKIEDAHVRGVRAAIVGRSSVLVYFDPLVLSFEDVDAFVRELIARGVQVHPLGGRKREVPTVYGGRFGPDLRNVAEVKGISEAEVIRLQSDATYTSVFLSFAPGLAQLMGLPAALAVNRKRSPDVVPAGAVVLTSLVVVMPVTTPSGWWWIGRTPISLFRPHAEEISYLLPGDEVRFTPISEAEYERLAVRSA